MHTVRQGLLRAPIVVALVAMAAAQALARPCPPCADTLCLDDEAAQRTYTEKRARLLASGAPERLVDSLLARTGHCEYCLRTLPDALHIMLEYPNGTRWTFAYSRYDEKLARQELRTKKISAFHIFIASDPCTCCGRLEAKEDPRTGLVPTETDSFTTPSQLGPAGDDPPDLSDVGQPPPYEFPPDLPHPAKAQPACPDCAAAAATRDKAAEDAWSAEHTWRRHIAEQEWDYRRATYAIAKGDTKAARDATRAARDWQVKVDQAAAELALAKEALKKADAAMQACNGRCPRAVEALPAVPGWRPVGSLELKVGPSLRLDGVIPHQLAIAAELRLRVLPREQRGYLTLAPFVAALGGVTTVGVPLGFEYDYEVARSGFFVYGRLSLGYVALLASFAGGGSRLDAVLILPEAGARYEFPRMPVIIGVDLLSLPLYVSSGATEVGYRITAYAGYRFGD